MHQHVAGRLDARLEEWRARLATGAHPCPGRFPAGDASGKTLLSLPNAQLSPAELRPSSARPSLQDSGLQDQDSRTRDSRTPRLQDSRHSEEGLIKDFLKGVAQGLLRGRFGVVEGLPKGCFGTC